MESNTESKMDDNMTKSVQENSPNDQTSVDSKAQESAKAQGSDKEVIKSLADTKNMDEANKQAFNVLMNGTEKDFIKHVFTNQETGQQRSYAEMRMLYG
tara:strand:- start:260 stop:556 length:297 start_codon:yes stop_codon:yes gene_type:complete